MDAAPIPTIDNTTTRAWRFPWMGPFLKALSIRGAVAPAAEKVGIARDRVYDLRKEDPNFAADWDAAIDRALDVAEDELYARAVEGWDEPVFQGGALAGVIRKKSDRLLEFMLTSRRRSTYGGLKDRQHETRTDTPARKVTFVRREPTHD